MKRSNDRQNDKKMKGKKEEIKIKIQHRIICLSMIDRKIRMLLFVFIQCLLSYSIVFQKFQIFFCCSALGAISKEKKVLIILQSNSPKIIRTEKVMSF